MPEQFDAPTKPRAKIKVEFPKQYKVLLHNDDYTPREFVVIVLVQVFRKSREAAQIMLAAHKNGVSVVGVYSYETAEMKVQQVKELAEEFEFPLQCLMEEE